MRKNIIIVVLGVLFALVLTGGGAVAGAALTGNSVKSWHIANGEVKGKDVANSSISRGDLNDVVNERLQAGKDAHDEVLQSADEWAADAVEYHATNPVNVSQIGGPFAAGAVEADSFNLSAGTYLISTEAFFLNNSATSGQSRMQLAVRGQDGSAWGSDLGTCFTGAISPLANREATCSTTRKVELSQDTTVSVKLFGYADDQGSADSGKVDGSIYLTATPVR